MALFWCVRVCGIFLALQEASSRQVACFQKNKTGLLVSKMLVYTASFALSAHIIQVQAPFFLFSNYSKKKRGRYFVWFGSRLLTEGKKPKI